MMPILSAVAYDNAVYDNATNQIKAIIDAFWAVGTALAVIAMGGNVLWFLQTLRRQQAVVE